MFGQKMLFYKRAKDIAADTYNKCALTKVFQYRF
jgi:hypothetical protein